MFLVGLTGGIGSGKTTVAKTFASLGAVVFDADKLAREVVELGTRGYAAVVELFGSDVLLPGGEVDRPALAKRVFSNDIERKELEAVLHPEIFHMLRERIKPFENTDSIVVFDAALLIESGFDDQCDMVISVEAPVDLRVDRVVREGLKNEADVRSRVAAQASEEVKAFRSDAIIQNNGTLEELKTQVDSIWAELQRRGSSAD